VLSFFIPLAAFPALMVTLDKTRGSLFEMIIPMDDPEVAEQQAEEKKK